MEIIGCHPAYNDTIDSLKNEFKDDISNTILICGAHVLSKTIDIHKYTNKYKKVIVFNQEPLLALQHQFMHPGYFEWLKQADEVWDYDSQNILALKSIRPDAKLHILKPYKQWPAEHPKDIDILFYGAMNDHRKQLLDYLSKKYKVVILRNEWNNLDNYILRSRILLNIHYYYECAMQEQARMVRWLGAPCKIISEKSATNYLGVEEYEYKELFKL